MYGSMLRNTASRSTSATRVKLKSTCLKNKCYPSLFMWLDEKNIKRHLEIICWPPSLGSASSSTFSSKLESFGKPSKCLVRIHDLAWTMIYSLLITVNIWFQSQMQQLWALFQNTWNLKLRKAFIKGKQKNSTLWSDVIHKWSLMSEPFSYTTYTHDKEELQISCTIGSLNHGQIVQN